MTKPSVSLITPVEKEIGDITYRVTPLDALLGRKVFLRFIKAVSPTVGALGKIQGSREDDMFEAIGRAVKEMNLSEEDFEFFCNTFAKSTRLVIGDKEPLLSDVFGTHFAGSYETMFQWLFFCLEVNYGSIPKALGIEIKKAPPKEAEKATS